MNVQDIPALNACLNAAATLAITVGLVAIKTGHKELHRKCMLTSAGLSAVFLIGYVAHKILVRGVHTPFGGDGMIKGFYYGMLFTHVVLAMAIAWLVPKTFYFAIKGDWETHRRWAKWTMPIWLYVSVTGVLVYLFLYQWWPASA
ncbi:MAG: DUF420 domain-containing protein [Opitutaceae bacterium]|nr:DUF420 domain-containing protein [Opitutaceae bacterium]